jgi:hypothetical protein
MQTQPVAQVETPPQETIANNPAVELPPTPPPVDQNLPTQHLPPVLSDYQF